MNMVLLQCRSRRPITGPAYMAIKRPIDTWRAAVWSLHQGQFTAKDIADILRCDVRLVKIEIEERERAPKEKPRRPSAL